MYEYSRQLLSIGCFYLEFVDGIREGDGERVHRCWKYLLLELKWSRFINCYNVGGRNIPCDLHLEHLNRLLKDAVRGLQANKTSAAISRVGKSVGTLSDEVEQFDESNDVQVPSGCHHAPATVKDRDLIVQELVDTAVFSPVSERHHDSFQHVKLWLKSFDHEALLSWMLEHM